MYKEEYIFAGSKKVAIIFRGFPKNTPYFPTPNSSFLQIGFHKSGVKKSNLPHRHERVWSKSKTPVYEILIIKRGKLKITFYDKRGGIIEEKTLKRDDSVLIMEVTHSVTFYKNTEIMEIKQGPYQPK